MEGSHLDLEVPAGALEELGVLFVHCSFPAEVGGCVPLGQDQSPPYTPSHMDGGQLVVLGTSLLPDTGGEVTRSEVVRVPSTWAAG